MTDEAAGNDSVFAAGFRGSARPFAVVAFFAPTLDVATGFGEAFRAADGFVFDVAFGTVFDVAFGDVFDVVFGDVADVVLADPAVDFFTTAGFFATGAFCAVADDLAADAFVADVFVAVVFVAVVFFAADDVFATVDAFAVVDFFAVVAFFAVVDFFVAAGFFAASFEPVDFFVSAGDFAVEPFRFDAATERVADVPADGFPGALDAALAVAFGAATGFDFLAALELRSAANDLGMAVLPLLPVLQRRPHPR